MKKKKKLKSKIAELTHQLLKMQVEKHQLEICNKLYVAQLELLNQSENK